MGVIYCGKIESVGAKILHLQSYFSALKFKKFTYLLKVHVSFWCQFFLSEKERKKNLSAGLYAHLFSNM